MEQSVSWSTVPAPIAPFLRCVWELVGAAIHRHGLIYSSLLVDALLPLSFSVLFLDARLHWRNAECFLMVAMTMTSGDHSAITS